MSTKSLKRTVIEGGRYGRNKWERRNSHAEVRAEERDYIKAVMTDPDLADETEIEVRQPVPKEFTDKLAPMYRWIEAQVGRPWDEVRSEIFQKFDTRTTAGRHITFDHLLREVVDTTTGFDNRGHIVDPEIPAIPAGGKYHFRYTADYYVDQDGILREDPEKNRRRHRYIISLVTEQEYTEAEAWLQNRMVIEQGGKFYWLMPAQDIWKASWFDPNTFGVSYNRWGYYNLHYYVLRNGEYETKQAFYPKWDPHQHYMTKKISGDHWEKVENPYSFRQRGELSFEDVKIFKCFKEKIQNDILSYSMGR